MIRTLLGVILCLVTILAVAALASTRTVHALTAISVQLSCTGDPEYVIITNTGDQVLDLSTFTIVSKFEPRPGEEFRLSGLLQPGLSLRIEAGTAAGNPGSILWTRQFVFDDLYINVEGLIILVGTARYEVPCGFGVNLLSFTLPSTVGAGSPGVTTAATPTTMAPVMASAGIQHAWYDLPPTTSGVVASCPPPDLWRLAYWGGPPLPIRQALAVCPVDVAWVNRQGDWFGFAPDYVEQSDNWTQSTGEAALLHGRSGAVPSASATTVAPAFITSPSPTLAPIQPVTSLVPGVPLYSGVRTTIEIVTFTASVARGGTASLTIRTVPGATCTLFYGPPPSRSSVPVPNAGPRRTDMNGYTTWNWTIDPATPPGTGAVTVVCNEQSTTQEIRIS